MDYFREPRAEEPNDLPIEDYENFVMNNLEDLSCFRLRALKNFEADRLRIEGQS